MNKLDLFVSKLCGTFDNSNQIKGEMENGKQLHPSAKHINGICNDKIKNLPDGFNGYFVIEESYYENGNFKNSLPHLFLFTLDESNNVVLTSYEIPKNIEKEDFRNDNEKLIINFEDLKISMKFNPMIYEESNGIFEGESISNFTPETEFTLKEKIEDDKIYVSEVFRKNGKITFGFVDPIVYEKVK